MKEINFPEGIKVVSDERHGDIRVIVVEELKIFSTGWYKRSHEDIYSFVDEKSKMYSGFADGEWSDSIADKDDLTDFGFMPADMNRVSELMIKEAEKRGYSSSTLVRSLFSKNINTLCKVVNTDMYTFNNNQLRCKIVNGSGCIWTSKHGWAEIIKDETPTIEQVQEKYPVGTRFKALSGVIFKIDGCLEVEDNDVYAKAYTVDDKNWGRVSIWTMGKGWAEIIEPLYINSLRERFYKGDRVYWVIKRNNTINYRYIDGIIPLDNKETDSVTETMMLASAEKYVKEHRVFEDGFYKCKIAGVDCVCEYDLNNNFWYITGLEDVYAIDHFDLIGDKITF